MFKPYLYRGLVYLAAALVFGSSLAILAYILWSGLPHLNWSLFSFEYTLANQSMLPAILNTILMIGLTLGLGLPLGIFTAILLVEYSKESSWWIRWIRLATQTLSGIPSIVFGLFGYLFFVVTLGWSYSLLGGALTLVLMILPLIIHTTEEALLAVPQSYREGSLALGASKQTTIYRVILPAARSGILSGIILSIGKIVGETAALIYTAGTVTGLVDSVLDSGRTLSVHMYALMSEGLYMDQAAAVGVVLLIIVLIINLISARLVTGGQHE